MATYTIMPSRPVASGPSLIVGDRNFGPSVPISGTATPAISRDGAVPIVPKFAITRSAPRSPQRVISPLVRRPFSGFGDASDPGDLVGTGMPVLAILGIGAAFVYVMVKFSKQRRD